MFFHKREKTKKIKYFAAKQFLCVWRSPWETSEHNKTFLLAKCFFHAYEKYICHNFKICFHKNLLVLSSSVFSNYNAFQIKWNKGIFLDVNLKPSFLRAKPPKSTKVRKCLTKNC